MESLAISQLPPISLSLPTIMPDIHMNFPDRVFLAVLFLCMIVTNRYLRHRRLTKFRGCQSSYRKAPVKDPFIGLDFIYDRFFRKSPDPSLARSCQTFRDLGSTYTVSRWTTQAIHTCDSRNVKYMLATGFEDFELPKVRVSVMTGLLGTGIFTLDGQSWSHARSVLRPTLTKQKMGSLPDILECHVQALLRRIPSDGNTLDLQPLFFAVTMDVATEFLMGHSTYMLDDSKTNNHEQQFVDDYMLCSEEAVKKMHLGPLSFLRFNKEADRAKDRVFKYVDDYIDESLRRDSSSATFMRELANAIESRKTLRDQVLHILLASRDTTASLLSNLFFVLAKKPEVYHRLRSEVLETVGDGLPTFDKLKDMEYLKWCINECKYSSFIFVMLCSEANWFQRYDCILSFLTMPVKPPQTRHSLMAAANMATHPCSSEKVQ